MNAIAEELEAELREQVGPGSSLRSGYAYGLERCLHDIRNAWNPTVTGGTHGLISIWCDQLQQRHDTDKCGVTDPMERDFYKGYCIAMEKCIEKLKHHTPTEKGTTMSIQPHELPESERPCEPEQTHADLAWETRLRTRIAEELQKVQEMEREIRNLKAIPEQPKKVLATGTETRFAGRDLPEPMFPPLTKREYFASAALQGILANNEPYGKWPDVADQAVAAADALLAELERRKP